jgi:hypothetical protein
MPETRTLAADARLTIPGFEQRFGTILAMPAALNAASQEIVNSALTRSRYIAYDWQRGEYISKPR